MRKHIVRSPILIRRALPSDAADYARIMGDPEVYIGLMQLPYASEDAWRARLSESLAPRQSRPAADCTPQRPGGRQCEKLRHMLHLVDGGTKGPARQEATRVGGCEFAFIGRFQGDIRFIWKSGARKSGLARLNFPGNSGGSTL
ncbi:hypothetical protein [Rhodoferax sp. OV413]|uniref:hypothetical protein n=1 Tax=Rhodoferax sp. OV413 TaxID=1855285 RepID=UPI0025D2CC0A|nr:hypothetical protein [Rhodoferax sp. OV413]